jgi:DNA-binding transcriptional MerR regulator
VVRVTENAAGRTGEWSIQDIARATGTTSRTLRHYGAVGLLQPSRVGGNGYRYYDEVALVRLQRILLLRELGLGLAAIAEVLAGQRDPAAALRRHLELLEAERDRLGRQIESVRTTLHKTERGEPLMATEVFDGFDHTRYRDEVTERWGREAYERGDTWWRGLSAVDRAEFQRREQDIAAGFGRLHLAGATPEGAEAQALVARHHEWVRAGWRGTGPTAEQYTGLGEMYTGDERFTAHYDEHGAGTAAFLRDAMDHYAEHHL